MFISQIGKIFTPEEVGVDVLEEDGLLPLIVPDVAIPGEINEGDALVGVEEKCDTVSNKCHRYIISYPLTLILHPIPPIPYPPSLIPFTHP